MGLLIILLVVLVYYLLILLGTHFEKNANHYMMKFMAKSGMDVPVIPYQDSLDRGEYIACTISALLLLGALLLFYFGVDTGTI